MLIENDWDRRKTEDLACHYNVAGSLGNYSKSSSPYEFLTDRLRQPLFNSVGRCSVRERWNSNCLPLATAEVLIRETVPATGKQEWHNNNQDSKAAHHAVIITNVDEIVSHALALLRSRDYSVAELRQKLEAIFGSVPPDVIDHLLKKRFLDDRRFVENYVASRKKRGTLKLQAELAARGIPTALIEDALSRVDWPSLQEALAARMNDWKLRSPLQSRDAARLFRALVRLGYEEDAIREEVEQLLDR